MQELVTANENQQVALRKLIDEYNALVNDEDANDDDTHRQITGGSSLRRPSSIDYSDALEVELSLLEDLKSTNDEKEDGDTEIIPSRSDSLLQRLVVSQGTTSEAQRHLETHNFGEEILESFQDLDHTVRTLEKVQKREESKLQSKQAFWDEQETLFQSLQEQLQQLRDTGKKNIENNTAALLSNNDEKAPSTSAEVTPQQSIMDRIERNHQWIRQELKYASQKLEPQDRTISSSNFKSKKRKRKKDLDPKGSSRAIVTPPTASPSLQKHMSVEQIVLPLLQRLLDDPRNPYLSLEADDDNDKNGSEQRLAALNSIHSLREWGVVRCHPENEHLICLTDYRY